MTITLCAFNRPDYLRQVVDSINANNLSLCHRAFVGVDHGGESSRIIAELNRLELDVSTFHHAQHVGMCENTITVLERAFEEESEYNVHVEDDVVLAPDALRMAAWAGSKADVVEFFARNEDAQSDPGTLCWYNWFNPWGWGCSRETFYAAIAPGWRERVVIKESDGIRREFYSAGLHRVFEAKKLRALRPTLSRSKHIGRLGTSETPEYWDEHFPKFNFCSTPYAGPYRIL